MLIQGTTSITLPPSFSGVRILTPPKLEKTGGVDTQHDSVIDSDNDNKDCIGKV